MKLKEKQKNREIHEGHKKRETKGSFSYSSVTRKSEVLKSEREQGSKGGKKN